LYNSIGQLNVTLCNQVHIMVADFLPCSGSWILFGIRRRWGRRSTNGCSTVTAAPPQTKPQFQANHGFCRKTSCGRYRSIQRLFEPWSEARYAIAESSGGGRLVASSSQRWWWRWRINRAELIPVMVPVSAIRIWRREDLRVRGAIVGCRTTVFFGARVISYGTLKPVSLWRWSLAVAYGWRCVSKRLDAVRIQGKVVEERKLLQCIAS
jgi:hypothetical protein